MAFDRLKHQLGPLAKLGTALSSTLGESVGLGGTLGLPIAIEFGTGSLKVLQVAAGNPPSLVAAACLETPDNLLTDHRKRLEFQLAGLPRLIKRGGFKGRRAVCAIPAWQMVCKHVSLPRSSGAELAAQVHEAISLQLARDPATLVYRFTEVTDAERGGKTDVIVSAVPRELVDRLMAAVVGCKLQPVGMHSEFSAVLRSFDHVHRRELDLQQNTLYMDIGASTTKVMISHGRELAFARVIDLGGKHLDELLMKQLKCDLADARRQRLQAALAFLPAPPVAKVVEAKSLVGAAVGALTGVAAGEAAAEDMRTGGKLPTAPGFTPEVTTEPPAELARSGDLREPVEALTDEVLMCLRYHRSQCPSRKVDRAIFVGGEARHRGLCQAIARALKLPAQMADPLARIARSGSEPALGVDLKQPQPGWAVALGLCLCPTDL